jgi:hypothetical protein
MTSRADVLDAKDAVLSWLEDAWWKAFERRRADPGEVALDVVTALVFGLPLLFLAA